MTAHLPRPVRIPARTVMVPFGLNVIALHEMWLVTRADGHGDLLLTLNEARRGHAAN